jgi:RHS repeat-associated protein
MKTNVSLSIRGIFAAMGLITFAVTGWGATATRTSSFTYDVNTGLLLSEAVEPDNASLCLTTTYTYDTYGNKLSTTTANCAGASGDAVFTSRSATAAFASAGSGTTLTQLGQFPTTVSNALGQSESKQYDNRFGSVASLTGPNALTTTWQFDSFGRKTREVRADGAQTKWEYLYCAGKASGTAVCPTVGGISGAWVVVTTPLASDGVTQNGPFVKVYFDQLGRELRQETQGFDGSGAAPSVYKDTEYNALGQVSRVSRPYQSGQSNYWVTYAYDAIGRVTSAAQPDGAVTQTSYSGFTTVVTNAKGQTQTTVRNSQGQTISSKDALNQQVTYAYDSFGNLISTTDAAGNVTRSTYDVRGRKTQMFDPDLGDWVYTYNALGELIQQISNSQLVKLTYDKLGRLVTRSEPDLISNWYYDTYKGGGACSKGVGKLCQSETTTGYSRTLSYDTLGRFVSASTTIGSSMSNSVSYDAQGRVATRTYPGGVVVAYVYSSLGYLKEVRRNNSSGALLWSANTLDAEGHVLNQTFGNSVSVTQTFDVRNGRVTAQTAGAGNAVQNVTYAYDTLGNVTNRNDSTQSLVETFAYDTLNRVTTATVNSSGAGIVTQNFSYNSATGNLTSRSDLGTYTYPATGALQPHAVSQINLPAGRTRKYFYDSNGNNYVFLILNSSGSAETSASYTYASFNMPTSMISTTLGTLSSETFSYGPEHQRVKKVSSLNGTTVYLNPGNTGSLFYEKDTLTNGNTEQRNFITAGGQVIGVVKQLVTAGVSSEKTIYFHRDALGSVAVVTDSTGAVVERLSYDAFGKRRNISGAADSAGTLKGVNTVKGYTGHEHLDSLGLIHMNGRVYDPVIARFMSADPYIQAPMNSQSYNRYSYVMNNPLSYSDPSGYLRIGGWSVSTSSVLRTAAVVAVAVWAPEISNYVGWTSGATAATGSTAVAAGSGAAALGIGTNAVATGMLAGGLGGAIMTGNFQGAVVGAAAGGAFGAVGSSYSGVENVAGHAAVGCASAVAGTGGGCGAGALSAAAGSAWTQYGVQMDSFAANLIANSVAGGTASVLGGGKFSNGAVTAAYGYLFNCVAHECWQQGAIGGLKAVGGALTVSTGATICGTSGVGCLAGGPMMAFGASDATQGATMMVDAFNGTTSDGLNPLKAGFISVRPNAGAMTYDVLSLGANVMAIGSKVPMYIGATDGIAQTGSLFGVTTSRWDQASAFANSITGQAGQMLNRATLAGSALWKSYGLSKDGGQ